MGYTSKRKGTEIDALLDKVENLPEGGVGGGVTIVDSVDKLDPNAKAGSLATVSIGEGVREYTYSKLLAETPESPETENLEEMMAYISNMPIMKNIDFGTPNIPTNSIMYYVLGVTITDTGEVEGMIIIRGTEEGCQAAYENNSGNNLQFVLFVYDEASQSYIKNEENINNMNNLFKDNTVYFGRDLLSGLVGDLSQEAIDYMDSFIKIYALGKPIADLYVKKDSWEKLYESDFNKILSALTDKQDSIKIQSYSPYKGMDPNIYYIYNYSRSSTPSIVLNQVEDAYAEYMIEISFTQDVDGVEFENKNNDSIDIKWMNGIPPVFVANSTCIISIVNGFGVYSMFYN